MVVQPERLGERIRTLRYRRGLTQAQLAYKAGVGEKTLKRVEAGQTDMPRPETLAALAGALGVATEALFEPAEGAAGPVAGMPAIHQLPRSPHNFVGRRAELEAVEARLAEGQELVGVHGMGGVGKTAFALLLAERASERHPGGQLYFDLRGSADERASVEAMQHVIRSLDPARPAPKSVSETAAVYRTALREQRVLLLLENVANAEQVEQLRPGAGSLLIVTSRARLALAGHVGVTLAPLELADACALIDTLAPHANAVQDTLAGLCGGLPLALSLAGRALAERPDLDPHEYAARLADDSGRLAQLDAAGSGGGSGGGVEASFELSFQMLEPTLRAELCALSVFPQGFDRAAVAAVWGLDLAATDARIGQLVRFNLLEWDGAGKVARYRLHDLVRLFVDARLPGEARLAAGLRHAQHYAERLFTAGADLEGGHDPAAALASIDQEWPHVRAAFAFCRAHANDVEGAGELCSRMPAATTVLRLRLHPRERIEWLEAALGQARARGDGRLSGRLLANLGRAHQELGDPRRARELCSAAQAIAEACGDTHTQAHALVALGDAHHALGEARLAIEASQRALKLARELGADADVAGALVVLGWGYQVLGDSVRAAEHAAEGLPIARRLGDRSLEATALLAIAFARQTLGDMEAAREHGEQVLAIARELGDRRMEGYAMLSLSQPMSPGSPAGARHREALAVARETGDLRMEGYATIMEGVSAGTANDLRGAIGHLERALAIADETGDKAMLGTVANALGVAYSAAGQAGRAIECLTRAELTLAETGNRRAESTSAWLLGSALEMTGDLEGAVAALERAARYQAETGQSSVVQMHGRIAALRARIDAKSGLT
jgi:transcriptional regulator with XRE-family HTH domain/tetratricopeptide (TPR) repeat protein